LLTDYPDVDILLGELAMRAGWHDTTRRGDGGMSKATKIDATTWHYRGFTIRADFNSTSFRGTVCKTRQGFRIDDAPGCGSGLRPWWSPSLAASIEQIDEWYTRSEAGRYDVWSLIPVAVNNARRIACERGETSACPDQHLCRHGIDN
jgi:hypothetical protein